MELPDEVQPFFDPLESLQNLISRFDGRGVIIGGVAIGVVGKARYTEDIDAMLLLSTTELPRLLDAAQQEGMEPRIENAVEFAKKSRVLLLRHVVTDTEIDISLGIMPFEQEMIERSALCEFDRSLRLRFPTPEDLIIMKAVAHRPKDLDDIRTLVARYPNLDVKRIKRWVSDFAEILEEPDLWKEIKKLLKG